ncbi:MAG: GntR family transcriptional regulator [Verrucomicrobia bacterium]|nr:GntR family transcriptional regulator [Verrucomicrobiota bacterium]
MKLSATLRSRSDQALAFLRARILDGDLKPGALLAESAVAVDLGVSRVPIREALFALERDGLVEFSETGRAYVKDLSPHDFEELYVLRLTLEPVAARLAAAALREDPSALEKNIEATRRASSLIKVTHLDLDFHEIILEASGNARLLKLWRSSGHELELWLGRLHRSKQIQTHGTREETVSTHCDLLECFRTQPPPVCERKMREHILGWREWLPAGMPVAAHDGTKSTTNRR